MAPLLKPVSLNKEFFLFRTNALQRRKFQRDQFKSEDDLEDDRVGLLRDAEEASGAESLKMSSLSPPSYVGQSEALEYQMNRAAKKVQILDEMHKAYLRRPAFDETTEDEEKIDAMTREVTQMIGSCHQQIKTLQRSTSHLRGLQGVLGKNLVTALSNRLHATTEQFRKSQNAYLKNIKSREESTKQYFNEDLMEHGSSGPATIEPEVTAGRLNTQQLLMLEDDTKVIEEREKEIQNVVQSIVELNTIFKDLAVMVSEQGSIIDRIDHNVENTQIRVADGLEQLKKAEKYQRKDKKMHCIVVLAVIVILELIILMIKLSL